MRTGKSNCVTLYIGSWGTFATYLFHSLSRKRLDNCSRGSFVTLQINLYGEHEGLCCYIFIDGEY